MFTRKIEVYKYLCIVGNVRESIVKASGRRDDTEDAGLASVYCAISASLLSEAKPKCPWRKPLPDPYALLLGEVCSASDHRGKCVAGVAGVAGRVADLAVTLAAAAAVRHVQRCCQC